MHTTAENDPKARWAAFQQFRQVHKKPVEQARRYLRAVEAKSGQELIKQRCGLAMRLIHGFALTSKDVVDLLHEWEIDQQLVPKSERIEDAVRWAEGKTYNGVKGDLLR